MAQGLFSRWLTSANMILRMPDARAVQTAMPDARAVQITSISGRTNRANHIHFRTHEPCVPTEKYRLTAKERNLIDTHM